MEIFKPNPKTIRLFFFWSGVVATLAYRIIIVLNFYSPLWVKISWYIGTIGFIIYFWHRFDIQKKRSELVLNHKLIDAVEKNQYENQEQKEALKYIVKTSLTSKSRWNSAFICLLSILALIVGLVMDITQIFK